MTFIYQTAQIMLEAIREYDIEEEGGDPGQLLPILKHIGEMQIGHKDSEHTLFFPMTIKFLDEDEQTVALVFNFSAGQVYVSNLYSRISTIKPLSIPGFPTQKPSKKAKV